MGNSVLCPGCLCLGYAALNRGCDWECSGCSVCSGANRVRVLENVRVVSFGELCCDYSSVFKFVRVNLVENLWESLGKSLRENGGKVGGFVENGAGGTAGGGKRRVFHGAVEKFSVKFFAGFNRVKWWFYTVSTGSTTTTINL